MFHLTNSVYVNLDAYMDRVNPHYNISSTTGFHAVVEDDTMITDHKQTQLGFAPSVREIGESQFRKWLVSMKEHTTGRMTVWVDPKSYVTLAAVQLMAMDPTLDKDSLKYFLMMTLVELDSTRIANGASILSDDTWFSVSENIDSIYKEAVRLSPVMRTVLYKNPSSWSLEWRVSEYIANGEPLGITALLRRILIRGTVMTCFEALFELKHLVGNPSTWDALGCTEESLLNAPNVFAGMTAFETINSKWMLALDPYDHNIRLDDLTAAASDATIIFNIAEDDRKIRTLNEQLDTLARLESGDLTPLQVLKLMFGTKVHGSRPCDRDCSKYNSVLIGHFLSKAE